MDTKLYLTIAAIVGNPLRAGLSVVSGTRIPVLQQFRGASGYLVSAVLRSGDPGVGPDRVVRARFQRLARGAQRTNRQRCWPCDQHYPKRLGDCNRLAQCECLGVNGCAYIVVEWSGTPACRPGSRRQTRASAIVSCLPPISNKTKVIFCTLCLRLHTLYQRDQTLT